MAYKVWEHDGDARTRPPRILNDFNLIEISDDKMEIKLHPALTLCILQIIPGKDKKTVEPLL